MLLHCFWFTLLVINNFSLEMLACVPSDQFSCDARDHPQILTVDGPQ
jgi:hypothetical protein